MDDLRQLAELAELADLHAIPRNAIIDRSNPFEDLTTQEFVARFRLSKESAMMVLEKIKPRMGRIRNQRGSPIPHHLQFLVALRYLATGNFQLSMGDCHEMSQPTVSRCVRSVSVKIADLAVEYITFPQPAEEEVVMQQFSLIAGMPGVIGCVDGTHIPIKSPGGVGLAVHTMPGFLMSRCYARGFREGIIEGSYWETMDILVGHIY
ncbi:putative nuclease HARBI1 [Penaeus japonicus]|uniref:putative nuclease HARBI1 n=1 Tax=Penaeus japonicus TaxID=27405 RepID=UPI001C71332A|nr:putative nuclease HARBI1 [Penaeus japonicus]